ncbi:putative ATPase/DNA-binding CsgD family transcriptional regulator [Marmoricola sp. URHA0025 HA25]
MVGVPRGLHLSTFVGRRDELARVHDLLRRYRLVTLVGTGGVGKTRLADEALVSPDAPPDIPIWRVELADLSDPSLLDQKVAECLGLRIGADTPDAESLSAHLGDHPGILYLDNCEHLLEASAALVALLLGSCPNLRVVTTSRQPLGLIGERLFPVPPMARAEAVGLFTDRALSVLPTWGPTDEDARAIAQLCETLEGIPLAIELAAVRIRSFSPTTLLDHLPGGALPAPTLRGAPVRRSSLDACVRWSYDLCVEAERALWSRLSVFAGGVSVAAAQHVCTGRGLDPGQVLDALAGLVDKSILERDPHEPEGRYRMLEIIRQFGSDRLREDDELDLWRRRHGAYYVELAERFSADMMGPHQTDWMRLFRAERANLNAAFDFAVATPEGSLTALRMAPVLEHFYASSGGGEEAIRWLQVALAHDVGPPRARAAALRVGTFVASIMASTQVAEAFLVDLRTLERDLPDDDRVRAELLYAESVWRAFSGDAETGARVAADGVELLHRLREDWLEANLLFLRGLMLGWADRPDEAAAAYRACLEIGEPQGERWLTSYSKWGLGLDALNAGRFDEAITLERDALRAKVDFGDTLGIGLTIEVLSWAAAEQRRGREAALLHGAAASIWDLIGMTVAAMPYVSRRREAGIALIGRLLGADEFDRLVEEGRALPREQAIAVALGDARTPDERSASVLTRREREIAGLVAEGGSNRAIAEALVISVRTVESHVESLMRKLGVTTRTKVAAALAEVAPTDQGPPSDLMPPAPSTSPGPAA